MVAYVAYVRSFHQDAEWKFTLHAETVLKDIGILEVRIDRTDAGLKASVIRSAGTDVIEIGAIEFDVLEVRLDVDLAETDVAFGPIVEAAEAAAEGRLVIRSERESDTWTEGPMHLVETAWRYRRYLGVGGGVNVGNASDLIRRDGVSSADQTIKRVP